MDKDVHLTFYRIFFKARTKKSVFWRNKARTRCVSICVPQRSVLGLFLCVFLNKQSSAKCKKKSDKNVRCADNFVIFQKTILE